jgi:SNF2 family DNA or RNA helicase
MPPSLTGRRARAPATPYAPMAHQKATLRKLKAHTILFDTSDPGTGKGYPQIVAFAERRRRGGKCLLVLAPKSLLHTVWFNDFAKFAPDMVCSIAYAEVRAKAFAAAADVYITTTDAASWLARQPKKFFARFDTVVLDESTSIKHMTSRRSRSLKTIKKHFIYRSALSGTPNSNTILDVWNQVNFLDDGARLGDNYYAFRSAVCAPHLVDTGSGKTVKRWEDIDGAEAVVFARIADIVVRHRFDDCIDIPETVRRTLDYQLSASQLKAYRQMQAACVAELANAVRVTAVNAAAVRTKLLQIASGAVYSSPGVYQLVDTGRYELVIELAAERRHPIVYFLWKHQRDQLVQHAEARGLRYCIFDGSASAADRAAMEAAYQKGFYDVMFAHPKSAAHGLTLTRGTSIIWPSPTDDAEWYAQANKRQARAGQQHKTEILMVLAPGTVEQAVYDNLMNKTGRMLNLLELFAGGQ